MQHELMERATQGDESARHALLDLHRDDLRRMVKTRLDRRISVRVDASDVVQDTLIDAWRRMDGYLRERPLPFLAWLRQLAGERIIDTHRRHVSSQCRGIHREQGPAGHSGESGAVSAPHLFAKDSSPSNVLVRKESQRRLKEAIVSLPAKDREVLTMRHIEQLTIAEIASKLAITEVAVKARLLRALDRLRTVMQSEV